MGPVRKGFEVQCRDVPDTYQGCVQPAFGYVPQAFSLFMKHKGPCTCPGSVCVLEHWHMFKIRPPWHLPRFDYARTRLFWGSVVEPFKLASGVPLQPNLFPFIFNSWAGISVSDYHYHYPLFYYREFLFLALPCVSVNSRWKMSLACHFYITVTVAVLSSGFLFTSLFPFWLPQNIPGIWYAMIAFGMVLHSMKEPPKSAFFDTSWV